MWTKHTFYSQDVWWGEGHRLAQTSRTCMWNNSQNIVGFRIFRGVEFMVTDWMWLLYGVRGHMYTFSRSQWVRWFRIDYELNMKRQSTSFHPEHKKAYKSCDFSIYFHTFSWSSSGISWTNVASFPPTETSRSSSLPLPPKHTSHPFHVVLLPRFRLFLLTMCEEEIKENTSWRWSSEGCKHA